MKKTLLALSVLMTGMTMAKEYRTELLEDQLGSVDPATGAEVVLAANMPAAGIRYVFVTVPHEVTKISNVTVLDKNGKTMDLKIPVSIIDQSTHDSPEMSGFKLHFSEPEGFQFKLSWISE